MSAHAYTEDQLVEQPATGGKAEGSMLKAEALPPEAITAAIDELTRDRSAMSLEAANREVYLLLKEGIKVSVPGSDSTPHPRSPPLRQLPCLVKPPVLDPFSREASQG